MVNEELFLWCDTNDVCTYHVGIEDGIHTYRVILTISLNDMSILFPYMDLLKITNKPVAITLHGTLNNP